MNLNEYKKIKLDEVDYFLKGIYFENINKNYEIIIENMLIEDKLHELEFINQNEICRELTESTLLNISAYRTELVDTYLEMSYSKEDVDKEINKFIEKVMIELNKLKNNVVNKLYIEKNSKKDQATLLNTNLDIFKIKIGNQNYNWKEDENSKSKKIRKNIQEEELLVADDLRMIIYYIYALPGMIKDKKFKLNALNAFTHSLTPGTLEHDSAFAYRLTLYNTTEYEMVEKIHNEALEQIPGYELFYRSLLEKELEDSKSKTRH